MLGQHDMRAGRRAALRELREQLTTMAPGAKGLLGRSIGLLGLHELKKLRLSEEERKTIVERLFPDGSELRQFVNRFVALMTLAVLIAVMGLLADSTAVVIGAMLVAPLMAPILGISAGIVMGWGGRVARSGLIAACGAMGAVGLAALASFVFPGDPLPLPNEVMARTSPNVLDLGIALAAGTAGAYSQIRRQASDAIIGVAVAVALVPPLSVIGILLELGEYHLALGALLLFVANVAGIVMAGAMTFIVLGLVPSHQLLSGTGRIASGLRWAAAAVVVVSLPLNFGRGPLEPALDDATVVDAAVTEVLAGLHPGAEAMDIVIDPTETVTSVRLLLASSDPPDADRFASALATELDTPVEMEIEVVETESVRSAVFGPDQ